MDWVRGVILLVVGIVLIVLESLFPYPISTIAYVGGVILAAIGVIWLVVGLIRGGTRTPL